MAQLILHEDPISANCYKIRLTAALLGIPLERRSYSVLKGETRTQEFLQNVSSFGRCPVLEIQRESEERILLPESNAACWYLADTAAADTDAAATTTSSTSSRTLIPTDPLGRAEMLRWMFFEQNQHETTIAALRFWLRFLGHQNLDESRRAQIAGKVAAGRQVLDCMQEHLAGHAWFAGGGGGDEGDNGITLADIVLFAYTHVAHHGGFDLAEWPAVRDWCERVTRVEGFVPMD